MSDHLARLSILWSPVDARPFEGASATQERLSLGCALAVWTGAAAGTWGVILGLWI